MNLQIYCNDDLGMLGRDVIRERFCVSNQKGKSHGELLLFIEIVDPSFTFSSQIVESNLGIFFVTVFINKMTDFEYGF